MGNTTDEAERERERETGTRGRDQGQDEEEEAGRGSACQARGTPPMALVRDLRAWVGV